MPLLYQFQHSSCLLDFLPRPRREIPGHPSSPYPLLPWLVRRIECIRGTLPILMQCAPAFNYARSPHTTTIIDDESIPDEPTQKKALFESDALSLDLRYVTECSASECIEPPQVTLELLDLSAKGHKGLAVQSLLKLREGQSVTFVLRIPPDETKTHGRTGVPSMVKHAQDEKKSVEYSMIEPVKFSHQQRRAPEDPFLTPKLMSSLLHVSYITFISFSPSQSLNYPEHESVLV